MFTATKTKHEILAPKEDLALAALGPHKFPACCWVRLTKWRAVSLAVVFLIATTMFIFQFIHPQVYQTAEEKKPCCNDRKIALKGNSFHSYDYDADLEGARKIRYKHTYRSLPQCLVIGVRKGGTRAILEYLNLHPCIQAQKKEMHFFDDQENYSLGLDWYRKKMPYSFEDQITIEKTPAYFTEEEVPERVYHMNKTIKLVIVIRDPTERAISDYTQIHANKMEKGKEHDSFEELAIDSETGEVRKTYNAVRRSVYHRHMERWLQWFPLAQFHFVDGEHLVANPAVELRKLETFLELEHKLGEENFYYNKTKGFYCIRTTDYEKCLAPSKGRMHPNISSWVINKLHEYFRPHNEKFFQLIGRRFSWS